MIEPGLNGDEIFTLKQVAQFLKLSPLTVHRLTKKGVLPGVKLGNQWRYSRRKVEDMMSQKRVA